MAKNKRSKILASMLAVSTMAVFYAAPVMAANVGIDGGNVSTNEGDITINSGTFNLNASNIATALKNQTIKLGADGHLQVASGNFLIGDVYIGATADTLTLDTAAGNPITLSFSDLQGIVRQDNVTADNKGVTEIEGTLVVNGQSEVISTFGGELTIDGNGNLRTVNDVVSSYQNKNYSLNNIGQNTEGIVREGDENSGGHRTIIEDQLVVNRDSKVISNKNASFTVDSSGNLVASTLGNRSATFGVNGEGDVTASSYNGVTLAIDDDKVLVGDIDVNDLYGRTKGIERLGRNGAGTTSIEGVLHVDKVSETVAIDGQLRVADDVTTINADGTEKYSLNKIGEQVGDIDGNVAGIKRNNGNLAYGEGSTTIEKTVSVDKWGLKVLDENGKTVASINSTNGGINAANGKFHVYSEGQIEGTALSLMNNGAQNVYIDNSGTARFGAVDGNNVRVEDGVLTVNRNSGQVAALSENGLTLTSSNDIRATLNAEQIANLNNVVQEDGNVVGTTVKTTSGADLDVVNNRTQNMTATEDSTIFDGKVTVNGTANITNGHGKYRFDDGLLDFNIDNGKNTFTMNSEHTSMNVGGNTLMLDNSGLTTSGAFKAANGNFDVDTDGNITAGTYNGVKIGMNEDGDIILGDGTVIDDNFNSDNVAGITRKPLDDSTPGSGNTTFIEQNTAISADGIVVTDPDSHVSTKTKYDGFYVKDKDGNNVSSLTKDKLNLAGENLAYKDSEGNINITADTYTAGDVAGENVRVKADGIYVKDGGTIVSSLKDDGLMLTDQESGKSHTLNATDIADIKGIDRSGNDIDGYTTTIEGATSFTKDGMTTNGLSVKGTYGGFHVEDVTNSETRESNTMIYTTDQEGHRTLSIDPNTGNLVTPGSLNVAGGRFVVDKDTGNMAVNAADGKAVFQVNGNDGTVHVGKVGGAQTVITGNSITTETLNVENIKLGNSMTDKDGNTITIGAAGVIDIEKDGNTVFHADTDNFEAHYDNYDLTLDGTNGFALSNETSKFTLNGNGFAFAGPVNLGAASDVKFGYTGNLGGYTGGNYNLSKLVDTVNDIYNRTDGIYKDADGNTVISNEKGTWNETNKKTEYTGEGSKITIGDNGTTFENGEGNGTTNINGSEIVSDATNVESGSGSGSGFGGGTSTTNGDNAVYVGEDGDYTHVSSDGVTIGDKTNTNTTNIDKDGMVVDGETGNTHISEGGMTVTDKTDNSTTNIDGNGMVVNGSNGTTHISDSGMTVTGDNGTTNISGGDISVDNSVTVGSGENQTVVNNDGVTVGGEEGTSIKHDEISVGDGGYIGGGDVVSGEGVSLNQTAERVGNLENRVGELEDRIDKVGAMAAAIANLRTMGYDPAAPTEVAVGIGQYRDETGAALGLFHYPNRDFMLSLSVSTSGDEVMGGIGATWKFGRKSPEKVAEIKKAQAEADVRRTEEAKLAKAEEMKQAAKEAKIKAQQERHAKLAAERAAQAEAAK